MLKVFLSSTSQDLREHRQAVRDAIDRRDDYKCVAMEAFGARAGSPRDVCRGLVSECDVFVGLLGHRYGFVAEGESLSMTELEYETAVSLQLPRLMFVADESLRPAGSTPDAKQEAFRARVQADQVVAWFDADTGELAARVGEALSNAAPQPVPRSGGRSLQLLAVIGALLVAAVVAWALMRKTPSQPTETAQLDDAVELLVLLAKVPDDDVRVQLFLTMTKRPADDPMIPQIRALRLAGDRPQDFEVPITQAEAASLDQQAVLRKLQPSTDVGTLPCKGQLEFTVRDGILACANGVPIALFKTPNAGDELAGHKLIVFHSTMSSSLQGTINVLMDPERRASAHLLIGADGAVVQLVPFDRKAFHTGQGEWHDLRSLNNWSIGIELVNIGKRNGQWVPFPDAQIKVTTAVAKAIARTYAIPEIVGHCHVSPGRKIDPGPLFPFADLQQALFGTVSQLPSCGQ